MLKPSVKTRDEDGILVAEFWDCLRLDPAPVRDLQKHYQAHVDGGGRPELVVDFEGVSFAGSAALSGLVNLQKLCRKHGGRIVLCNLESAVVEALRISRLDPLFATAADVPEALDLLRNDDAA